MTHDMPVSRSAQTPVSRRTTFIIAILAAVASIAVVALVVVLASGSDDDKPDSTKGSGHAETAQSYIFMAKTEGSLAKLDMTVGPDGQINKEHVYVRFADDGEPYSGDPEPFGGTFTDGNFTLTGLSSNGRTYTGTLEGDTLILDGEFGPSTKEWTLIQSDAKLDDAVENHTPPTFECEGEGSFGCGEN